MKLCRITYNLNSKKEWNRFLLKLSLVWLALLNFNAPFNIFSQTSQQITKREYSTSFRVISTKDGLASNDVRKIHCDSKGFIWVATVNGLNRFDGKTFLHFTMEDGLGSNDIHWMAEDGQERLWVRSMLKDNTFQIDILDLNTLEIRQLEDYLESDHSFVLGNFDFKEKGKYFLDQSKGGGGDVILIDENFQTQKLYEQIEPVPTYRIDVSPKGDMLLTQNLNHLPKTILVSKEGKKVLVFPFIAEYTRFNGNRSEVIGYHQGQDSLYILEDNRLIEVKPLPKFREESITELQIMRYDHKSEQYSILTQNQVFILDRNFQILADYDTGIHDEQPGIILHQPIFDHQGNVWYCSVRHGIVQFKQDQNLLRTASKLKIDEDFIRKKIVPGQPILNAEDQEWLANRCLNSYDRERDVFNKWELEYPFNLKIADSTPEGKLVFIAEKETDRALSLFIYEKDGLTWQTFPLKGISGNEYSPYALFKDSKGFVWIGMYNNGIIILEEKSGEAKVFSEFNGISKEELNRIQQFKESENGIWISSGKGLYFYKYGEGIIRKYSSDSEGVHQIPPKPQDVYLGDKGKIWITFYGFGLGILDYEKDIFTNFTINDGLKNNILHEIIDDNKGHLWISGREGIMHIDKQTKEISSIQFGEGLNNNIYNDDVAFVDDRMIFSSCLGVLTFKPEDLKDSIQMPFKVSALDILDQTTGQYESRLKEYLSKREIILNPNQSVAAVQIALLDYFNPSRHTYQYRLKGFNNDWITTRDSRLILAGLPYGDFQLEVKCTNEYGQQNKEIIKVPIIVLKPFYLQFWFIGLCLLAMAFLGTAFFKWRTNIYKVRQKVLEKSIGEATQTIRHQNEELKNLDKVKSRFFANVSHELRTPLTLMLGPIDSALKEKGLTPRNRTFLKLAQQSGEKLHDLINEILDLTKMEKGKLELHESPTVLYVFIRRLLAAFESHAEKKKISFEFSYQPDQYLQLKLDQKKFEKILNNLVSNALKYTPEGGTVSIQINELPNKVQLEVKDSGIGIHPNDLPHVFDRFYQSKRPEAAAAGGTGIGLALSMEFSKLMKGDLWVESELGKGSRFVFEFPKREILKSIPASDAKEILEPTVVLNDKSAGNNVKVSKSLNIEGRSTILIVEDNPNLREYIQTILGDYWNIHTAENGKVALEMLGVEGRSIDTALKSPPDLILSDLMMPVMDGYQLLNTLKSSDQFRSIPFIMLTARAEMEDKLQALRFGVDDYMMKPFAEEELLIRIENLLKNSKERRAASLDQSEEDKNTTSKAPISNVSAEEMEWLKKLETIALENAGNFSLNADFLASQMFTSRVQMFRIVKKLTGYTLTQYIQGIRLQQARKLLETKEVNSVKVAALSVGYKQVDKFSQNFKKHFGRLPSSYL